MTDLINITPPQTILVPVPGVPGPAGEDGADGTGGGGAALPEGGHLVYGAVDQYPGPPTGDVDNIVAFADTDNAVQFMRIRDVLDLNTQREDSVRENHPWMVTRDGGVTVTETGGPSASVSVSATDADAPMYLRQVADFGEVVHNLGLTFYLTQSGSNMATDTVQLMVGLRITGLAGIFGSDDLLYFIDAGEGTVRSPRTLTYATEMVLLESAPGAAIASSVQDFKASIEAAYPGSSVEPQGLWLNCPTIDQDYQVELIGRFDTDQRQKTLMDLNVAVPALLARIETLEAQVAGLVPPLA